MLFANDASLLPMICAFANDLKQHFQKRRLLFFFTALLWWLYTSHGCWIYVSIAVNINFFKNSGKPIGRKWTFFLFYVFYSASCWDCVQLLRNRQSLINRLTRDITSQCRECFLRIEFTNQCFNIRFFIATRE